VAQWQRRDILNAFGDARRTFARPEGVGVRTQRPPSRAYLFMCW